MDAAELYVVTGSLGYTGKYITRLLLSRGKRVKTLTGHPNRQNPFGDRIQIDGKPSGFQGSSHREDASE